MMTSEFLDPQQADALRELAARTGQSESDLLRKAVETLLREAAAEDRLTLLRRGRGIWEHRDDLTDNYFMQVRQGWERHLDWE